MPAVTTPLLQQTSKQEWLMDTAEGLAQLPPPIDLFQRLKLIAGLLKDGGRLTKPGRYLLWRDGNGQTRHRLIDRDLVIGRASACDIVIGSPRVSRSHCLIRHHPEADIVEDMNSSAGTELNGRRHCQPRVLCDADLLALGGQPLVYLIFGNAGSDSAPCAR